MKTGKVLMFVFCFILCGASAGWAKSSKALIELDNYLIPLNQKGARIGKIVSKFRGKIVLVKDTTGIFAIDRKGNINLRNGVELTKSTPSFCYGITIECNGIQTDFELLKDEFIHNKVVAHRGAWKNHDASQNSLTSLKNAIAIGCEGSEFDVWLSSDSALIISHDGTIGGKIIEQTTAEELKKVSLKNGDFVPNLQEYLLGIKGQNKTRLFLEIKSSAISQERSIALTDRIVKMVHDLKVQAWVTYISFNYDVLKHVKKLDPGAKTAYLAGDKKIEQVKSDGMDGIDYPFYSFHHNDGITDNAHKLGLSVNVWTVDNKEEFNFLLKQGVDLITTNEPEMLLEIVSGQK